MAYSEQQQREIFHFLFLEQLLKLSDPNIYVVKGGVNLRFFFNSPRYSEGMDIDVFAGGVDTLKKNGYKILNQPGFRRALRTYGIADLRVNDPGKAKHTETTQRFRLQLVTEGGEALPTKIEFSRREAEPEGSQTDLINRDIARQYGKLAYRARHYSGEYAVRQKLLALIGRSVTQARDVFDLYLLNLAGYCNPSVFRRACEAQQRQIALDHLISMEYASFEGQVLEYLDPEIRADYNSKARWEDMKTTLLEALGDE